MLLFINVLHLKCCIIFSVFGFLFLIFFIEFFKLILYIGIPCLSVAAILGENGIKFFALYKL